MDQSTEPVVISNGVLTALIDPLGAELISLRDSQGREFMTDADPAFWTGHAPLLFPIVGRLNGDILRVDGREYHMRQHGFARRMVWDLLSHHANKVSFCLSDSPATRDQYPFPFRLTAQYTLAGNGLSILVRVGNPGDRALPFSFGFHPAFAWPLPDGGNKSMHRIEFEEAEGPHILRLDANGLLGNIEQTPLQAGSIPLTAALFDAGAMIWDQLRSRSLSYRSTTGPWLEIRSDLPQLGIWQKPGANFICIEPWAGLADAPHFAGEFADKPGITLLPLGDQRTFAMDVTIQSL